MLAASVAAKSAVAQKPAAPPVKMPKPAAIAPGPVPWMRGLMDVKPLPVSSLVPDQVAETSASFFSATQLATLRHLGDILQPPYNGYPGASEAGAPEFLDFLIGASPAEIQQMYQSGLDRLESEAQQNFHKSFATVDAAQADKLIRPWLRSWQNEHPPTEPYERFISLVQNDVRAATENSQPWAEAAHKAGKPTPNVDLYWYPIDPDLRREQALGGPSMCSTKH
jgi:hypothetical protein